MTDQTGADTGSSGADSHGAGSVNAAKGAASAPPELHQRGVPIAENPRSRGMSPARDQREHATAQGAPGGEQHGQDAGATPQTIKVGDAEFTTQQVNDALKFKAEQDIRKSGLPASPDKYETKLPPDFQAPEGIKFEFNQQDPLLKTARELAHKQGRSQEEFSEMLGLYAATQIGQHQQLATARTAELAKLGTAAPQRIDAIETWLKSQVGTKADLLIAQLKNYPVASFIEAFEQLARNASSQGAAPFSQSGRHVEEPNTGKIAGFENMSYAQKRAAQDAQAARGRGR